MGFAPMRPTGACTFCDSMALTISEGAMPRLFRRWTSNQIRMEYLSLPNSEACPTPGVRDSSSSTLMVA